MPKDCSILTQEDLVLMRNQGLSLLKIRKLSEELKLPFDDEEDQYADDEGEQMDAGDAGDPPDFHGGLLGAASVETQEDAQSSKNTSTQL